MGKSNAGNIPDTFIESNKKHQEPKAAANAFNNYFTDVGPSISSKISHVNGSIYDYLNKKCEKSVFLMSVIESEVASAVNELCLDISTDYIDLYMEIIKHVMSKIAKPHCYISNKCFLDGTFPDKMKIAKIIPIYKSGHKNLICNYRPISLLSQFTKILAKFLGKRFENYLTKNNLLNDSQYGFRHNRSTCVALVTFNDEITSLLDRKLTTVSMSIDFKKSNSYIHHNILIKKYGFERYCNKLA